MCYIVFDLMNEGIEVIDESNFGDGKKWYSICFSYDGCWMIDVICLFFGVYVIEKVFYYGDEDIKIDIILFIDDNLNIKFNEIINGIWGYFDVNYVFVLDRFG